MIFLGRGLKNHFSLRSRRERKADKTPPFANSSVTLAAGERSTLVHKGLELDLARSMVTNTQTGTSTELTKNELRILSLLLSRAGKIVSRSAIMQDLWDSDAFVDDNTLTVNINRLRTTLEKIGIKGYLTTHRGQGYSV